MHRVATLTLITLLARTAVAKDVSGEPGNPTPVLGEDEQLYSCKSRTGEVAVQFKPEMEVKELLAWVMGFTCKNFVLDPRIVSTGRKVTIIAPSRMTAEDAYRLFLVSLATINYTLVPMGKVVKVVESQQAKRETVPMIKGGGVDGSATIVRYVYRPNYAQADSMVQAFTQLKSDAGDVQLIGGMLLVTDYSSHVRDMLTLGKLIDVPKGSDGLYLLPVKHADATKLREKLDQLLGIQASNAAQGGKLDPKAPVMPVAIAVPSKILVDERTNTLIIAASANAYDRVKALVEGIDVPLDIEGGAAVHVYRLGSSVAEELAKTLEAAVGSGRSQQQQQPAKAGAPPPPPASPVDQLGTALEGQVRVIADKPTNSLIVMSSGRDYIALKEIIRQLDVPRRQVYIETVILEVSAGSSLDFGTSSHGGLPGLGGMLLGGVQLPSLSSLALTSGSGALPTGMVGALIGKELPGSVSLFGKSIPSYGILFQALANNDRTRVITAPSIIGIDNEETNHRSGVNISYERGSSSFQGGGVTTTQNIERKPLELKLWIKPHVFVDEQVMIELKLDSEDLGGEDKLKQPIWNNRNIETRLIVRDQQTVVVGGMTQEREFSSASKVPLLGDLPIVGHLFKYTKREKRKTNLLVMMTPYIVKDHLDLQMMVDRKLRENREFAGSFNALDHAKYTPKMDYTRKRGLIEEINRSILAVEEDVATRASLKQPPAIKAGPIEYGDSQ
jgi:general secretion pathway protein D